MGRAVTASSCSSQGEGYLEFRKAQPRKSTHRSSGYCGASSQRELPSHQTMPTLHKHHVYTMLKLRTNRLSHSQDQEF